MRMTKLKERVSVFCDQGKAGYLIFRGANFEESNWRSHHDPLQIVYTL